MKKRFFVLLMVLSALLCLSLPAHAVELPVKAKAALLMEKETGQVLFAQNEHEKLEPASVTKIMTLSQVYLSEGEQISVEELLKAVCVSSGNDAAVALAEQVAGVTELFVQQMNNRAMELGMGDTHFVNPTGLPAEGHVTSAWDIALMSRELVLHHPDIRRFTTIWMDTIRGGEFGLSNTNKLIRFYDGATGLKTGSTDAAGYCISATAEREGMELIAVVLGSETSQQRFEDAKTMLNYGFSTYVLADVTPEETPVAPVRLGPDGEAAGGPVGSCGKGAGRRHSHGAEWGYHPGRASSDGGSGRGTHDLGGPVYPPAPRRCFRIRNQAVFSCIFHRLDVT